MRKTILIICMTLVLHASLAAAPGQAITTNQEPDQSGRNMFLVGTTILALGYWGPTLPIALNVEDPTRFAGIYLLTAAAGFFVPYFLTQDSTLTTGTATFALTGGFKGNADGLLLYMLLKGDDDFTSEQGFIGSMLLTSIGELIAFYKIAEKHNYSTGKANLMTVTSTFGTLYSFLTLGILDSWSSTRPMAGAMLGGSFLGYLAGIHLFDPDQYGDGDYVMPFLGGTLAGLLPITITTALAPDSSPSARLYCGLSLATSIGGLLIGDRLVRNINLSSSQGNYISLGTFGGALISMGLIFAFGGDNEKTMQLIPLATVLGAGGGMAIVYSTMKKKASRKTRSVLRFDFNPAALALGFREKSFASSVNTGFSPLPGVTASLSF